MKAETRLFGWTLPRAEGRRRRLWLNLLLFLVTIVTTSMAGALQKGVNPLADPWQITSGLSFALTLMAILLVHEMGHYLMARYHGVQATLPYFIPAPSFIGTFGAFIKLESPPADRRSLFDVGAAGPIAGLALALPAVVVGLQLSTVSTGDGAGGGIILGSSILLRLLSLLTLGFVPDEVDIILHPVAFAGWIGLLVTALNLLPVGQLDGGHVAYALFGRKQIWVSYLALAVILLLGLLQFWQGWLIWGILLLFLGVGHPPPRDPHTPLDFKRKLTGWLVLGILALTFTPAPFSVPPPRLQEQRFAPKPAGPLPGRIQAAPEAFHERTTHLASILHDHHPTGGRALHL